jgi:hypothetical protein
MTRATSRLQGSFDRTREAGTAAIEFGLFIPVLLLLITGTVELGFAMYEAMQVNNAVEAGMLYAAKNGWDSAGIENAVVNAGSIYRGDSPSLTATPAPTQFCGCPQASGIVKTTCVLPPPCADGSPVGQYVRINASLDHMTVMPNSGLPLPDTFTAKAVLRLN